MKTYEVMLLVGGDLPEVEINKVLAEFNKELEAVKGKITFEDAWGRRELAYPIQNQEEGFYVVYKFTLDPKALVELESWLRLKKEILRYLITIPVKGQEEKAYAQSIEEERVRRETKKTEKLKKEKEMQAKEQEKFAIKAERKEKKMLRKIEEEIQEEKQIGQTEQTDVGNKVDANFDEKLSKIIGEDLNI